MPGKVLEVCGSDIMVSSIFIGLNHVILHNKICICDDLLEMVKVCNFYSTGCDKRMATTLKTCIRTPF